MGSAELWPNKRTFWEIKMYYWWLFLVKRTFWERKTYFEPNFILCLVNFRRALHAGLLPSMVMAHWDIVIKSYFDSSLSSISKINYIYHQSLLFHIKIIKKYTINRITNSILNTFQQGWHHTCYWRLSRVLLLEQK